MRMGLRNKTKLWFAQYTEAETIYKTDSKGNIVTVFVKGVGDVPVELGKKPSGYKNVTEFYANITTSGSGEAQAVEYGIDLSNYSAKIVVPNNSLPLKENSLIWRICPDVDEEGFADGKTADYRIVKISQNLHYTVYLLDTVVK